MKSAMGYTSEGEARSEHGTRYVVWYIRQPAGETLYVPFTNIREADRFVKAHVDALGATACAAGICGEQEEGAYQFLY